MKILQKIDFSLNMGLDYIRKQSKFSPIGVGFEFIF